MWRVATRCVEEAMTDVQVTMSWAKTNDKDKHIVREGILIYQAKDKMWRVATTCGILILGQGLRVRL